MAERSAAALHWVVVTLVLWGLTRLIPPTGTRRKPSTATRAVVTSKNAGDPRAPAECAPAVRRSPYSTDRAPLDGSASRLSRPYLPALMDSVAAPRAARVRPYWAARERAVRLRRLAITVLAVDFGISGDTRNIHAELSAVRAR
ncbi:hypothetical protein [Streptomyces sp. NBC_00576]|uniref:hypothetical protein n=1 Tax=Streptomyces sp. NBC_00576 TaxID=2903665 RepID=UPI002E817A5C|nr:hypothetical protein [Streptomyces sp. NBC_00576]WUB71814.1 hypothetical protein OG734_17865 [Streptomyces sp. NBC_00576]